MKPNILFTLLNVGQAGISEDIIQSILPEIRPFVVSNQLAIMNGICGPEEFAFCYQSLCKGLDECFWNQEKPYIIIPRNHTIRPEKAANTLPLEKNILSAAFCGNTLQAEAALNQFYSYCKSCSLIRSEFQEAVKRLLLALVSLHTGQQDIVSLMNSVCELDTPEEIMSILTGLLKPQGSADTQNPQITEALKIINDNFDKDLKLEDVAGKIFLSPGYLSRIFKTETGYSFTEYLNRIRIEKAKELIANSDLKYYQIAEQVGYHDYKYFSAYFSKFCGCSAKEFKSRTRQLHQNMGN